MTALIWVVLAGTAQDTRGDAPLRFMQRIGDTETRIAGTLLHLSAQGLRLAVVATVGWTCLRVLAPALARRLAARDSVRLKLVPPGDVPLDAEAWTGFFRSLRATTPPAWKRWLVGTPWITFEYRQVGGLLTTTCWCPAAAEGLLTACLRSAVPGIEVTPITEVEPLAQLPAGRARLSMWRDPVYPLGQPRSDPLGSAVEALTLAPEALLQVAVAHEPGWERRALKRLDGLSGYRGQTSPLLRLLLSIASELLSILLPGSGRSGSQRADTIRPPRIPSLRAAAPPPDKAFAAAWRTEVRVCAWSPARGQAKRCALAIVGAFHALDGDNQLRASRVLLPWSFDRAMARRSAPRGSRLLLSAQELAWFFHLPVSGARMEAARVSLAPLPRAASVHGSVLCRADASGRPIEIAQPDRRQHMSILGPTGSGKSALILNLVLQDAEAA